MTNIKYSKRFKLRNGERVDFCPECDYHITDYVDKYQADKFFECATNRVFKIIPTIEGDKE